MAAEEGDIITFIFTGAEGEIIPHYATRFIAHESVTVIPARLFYQHPNIVELICHAGVIGVEHSAFSFCPRLRRLIIPGVKIVEHRAFVGCKAVTYVECDQLERIGDNAFNGCTSLSNINLPSAKIVEGRAFANCLAMTDVKFGKNLESIEGEAFYNCPSLERITIPLKNDLIAEDDIFQRCRKLKLIYLIEESVLRETIATLLLEEWRNDMNEEIESINQILPNTLAGGLMNEGGKAITIREWISRVLHKIIHYKAEHRRLLTEASTSLMLALPNDIVMNNVLPFLELPAHTFEGDEEFEEGSNISDDNDDESYDTSDGGDDDNDEDGDEDDNNDNSESNNASFGRGHQEEEQGEDEGRKRRKTTDKTE